MTHAHDVSVAAGGIDEIAAVERIMQAAFDPRYGEAWNKAQCVAIFAMPGYALRVARRGEEVVGFAIIRWVANESELLLLAVAPDHRQGGVGAALMEDWLSWTAAKGVTNHFLEMRTDNPAIGLYRRHGFVTAAIRPNYYRGGDGTLRDAVTMRRQD